MFVSIINISLAYLSVCLSVRPFLRWVRITAHPSASLAAEPLFLTSNKRLWTTSLEYASDIPGVIDGSDSNDDDINTVTAE